MVIVANGKSEAQIRLNKAGEVVVEAGAIKLGEGADQSLVLGNKMMQLFNQHTHGTGVGPSSPPTQLMNSSHLSSKSSTE